MSLIILLIAGLAVGIGLGEIARGDNVLGVDLDVTTAIQRTQGVGLEFLANVGNILGSTAGASVAIVISIGIAAARRVTPELVYLITLLILRLIGTQLKPIFDSPRPTEDLVTLTASWDGTGYPSGHALTASTMALGLAVIAWRRIPSRRWSIVTISILLVLALVIGWARVWSGAHWASDVVGGYAFGVAIVAGSTLGLAAIDRRNGSTA